MPLVMHGHLQVIDLNVMVRWLFVLRAFSVIVMLADFVHHICWFYRPLLEFYELIRIQIVIIQFYHHYKNRPQNCRQINKLLIITKFGCCFCLCADLYAMIRIILNKILERIFPNLSYNENVWILLIFISIWHIEFLEEFQWKIFRSKHVL